MATSGNTWRIRPPQTSGDRDGTDRFYQEKIEHETRIGFLFQKLHRPRSYDYLKTEREVQDLGRPAADAAVRLGQRSGRRRGGDDFRPRADRREDRLQVSAQGQLQRRPDRAGARAARCSIGTIARAAMSWRCPSSTLPEGTKVADAFTDFKVQREVVVHGTQ